MTKFNSNVDLSFKEFKNQSQCSVCGFSGVASILHFHHINPNVKIDEIGVFISNRDYYGTIGELVKCTILCANCHTLFHNSTAMVQELMKAQFTEVNIDLFLTICKLYNAYDSDNDTNPNLDLVKRIIVLEQEVKALKSMLSKQYFKKSEKEQIRIQTALKNSPDFESTVIETYIKTKSLNKTTQTVFGNGKVGSFYIKKVKFILQKHGINF